VVHCLESVEKAVANGSDQNPIYMDYMLVIIYNHMNELSMGLDAYTCEIIAHRIVELRALLNHLYDDGEDEK
jgi:hypothetical protein